MSNKNINESSWNEWATTGILSRTDHIKLLEDVRFVATENAKTPNGRRSTNKKVIEHAVAEVKRQYGSEMADVARDYLNSNK